MLFSSEIKDKTIKNFKEAYKETADSDEVEPLETWVIARLHHIAPDIRTGTSTGGSHLCDVQYLLAHIL